MSETIRLSYAELAEKLGITREAAKSRVRRAGWQRISDNAGIVKFNVPKDVFDTPCRHPVDTGTQDIPPVSATPHDDTAVTLAAIEALKGALDRSEAARAEAQKDLVSISEQLGRVTAERDAALESLAKAQQRQAKPPPPSPRATPPKEAPRPKRKWWLLWMD